MLIGESAVGDDMNAAHLNIVFGDRSGPVGTAWATALATPSAGHAPFIAVLQPSTAVKPFTLFVTKSAPTTAAHEALTWGPAQAGVAAGVADAVLDGTISSEQCDSHVVIAAVWVNPAANDADIVYRNNRAATASALRNGVAGGPSDEAQRTARATVFNGLYTAPD